jgi:hypothetical protein
VESALNKLTDRERDTIIAALRYWQAAGDNGDLKNNDEIIEIATNGRKGEDACLSSVEIDELIEEHINGDLSSPCDNREATMFFDESGIEIRLGDTLRAAVNISGSLHGAWVDYNVEKCPGGYKLAYLRSEKGQIRPVGYTTELMSKVLTDRHEIDFRELLFTHQPIQVHGWTIVPKT